MRFVSVLCCVIALIGCEQAGAPADPPTPPEQGAPEAPAEPEPAEPEPAEPEPAEPEPAEPEPAEPEPAEPEPAEPEPVEPEPVEPEPIEPEPVEPEPVEPADCRAYVIDAEDRIEDGRFRVSIAPNSGSLAGMCAVSHPSIRQGADALFAFTAQHGGDHVFRTLGSVTMVSLHSACSRDVEPLWCAQSPHHHDQGLGRWPFTVSRALDAGETIYLQLDGFHPNQLGLSVYPPVGVDDACGQAWRDADGFSTVARCAGGTECHEGVCQIPPPPGELGAACDDFARCDAALFCQEGACIEPPAPVIESFWAYWHDGLLHVEARVFDPARQMRDEILRVGDVVLQHRQTGTTRRRLTSTAAFAVAPEEVVLVDGDGRIHARQPVEDQPERAAGERCARGSPADRCAVGTVCGGPDGARVCVPVQVFAWRSMDDPARIILDVRGEGVPAGTAFYRDQLRVAEVRRDETRWIGESAGAGDGPFEIRSDGALVQADVPVRMPAERADRAACDPWRYADRCAEDSACLAGICRSVAAPVIEDAVLVWDHWTDVTGIWIRGRDPDGDVAGWQVEDREGTFEQRDRPWETAVVTVDGPAFEAWISFEGPWFGFREAEIRAVDAEGLVSAPFLVDGGHPDERAPVAEGARCDRVGALFPCEDALLCDAEDGQDVPPTCTVPVACPEGLATPLLLDTPLHVEGLDTDHTRVTCRDGWGPDGYFEFVPPQDGHYVVEVQGNNPAGLAFRQSCRHLHSELACATEVYRLDNFGGIGTLVGAQLSAGEPVTIVVDGLATFDVEIRRR